MKIREKIKNYYKKHQTTINAVLTGVGFFTAGVISHKLVEKIIDIRDTKHAMDGWEVAKLDDGTEISTFGYKMEESLKSLEENQRKAREDYPEKFEIMEEAIEKLNLDTEDNEMWMIENGVPIMFKDSWYQNGSKES